MPKLPVRLVSILIVSLYSMLFFGCATVLQQQPQAPSGMPGVYHRVEKGQTLWGISKIYGTDLEEITRINHISDATKVERGQLIFIPNRMNRQQQAHRFFADDFIWPVKGRIINAFGQTFNSMVNKGINILPYGAAEVVAARSGRIVFYSDNFGEYGKTIIIDHGDGFSTIYARNYQVFIKVGEEVGRGAVIAKVASSGSERNAYLHFEIRKGYSPVNPYHYLP